MSAEDDEAGSQVAHDAIEDILDQYRFLWEPEYRVKIKKELMGYSVGLGLSKPHMATQRLRVTVKPTHREGNPWFAPGRYVQKVLLMPQQSFAALYSRKLAWGILRCQFVAGYFWDRQRPSFDYRISTKWNDGLRMKRKEYYQPTDKLLLRAKWSLDMELPDVEGHLGGIENSTQVPVDVEYGRLEFSVVQLDAVWDLDGVKPHGAAAEGGRRAEEGGKGKAKQLAPAGAAAASPAAAGEVTPGGHPRGLAGRISWPWQAQPSR